MSQPLWQPDATQIQATRLSEFIRHTRRELPDYDAIWQWSVDDREAFWQEVWQFCGVIGEQGHTVLSQRDAMPGAQWFPEARLNFAENLLQRQDEGEALVFWGEDQVKQRWTHAALYQEVSRFEQALRAHGIRVGDRVAGMMPNLPATLIAMLACSAIGAIWSSCSPDFGVDGALDRFSQIEPKVWLVPDGYWYNGKRIEITEKVRAIAAGLPSVTKIVVVPYLEQGALAEFVDPRAQTWAEFIAPFSATEIGFTRLPFNHPLYILFSSGTTGKPKCIVHGAGGTLLQHLKEHQLHADVRAGDRLFYFTTCGWMMWNWLVSGLASGATLLLFDGSPFAAQGSILWDYAQAEHCTHFGTSAKYLDAAAKMGLKPRETHDLSALRALFSTGSPLVAEGFDYVYREIKANLNLASISGGTDIVSCFALGCANLPVYQGELQCRGLGMAVDIVNEQGESVRQEKGELVCRAPFPSMPIGFWNDPTGEKYHSAYFGRFEGIWCHGDFAEITAHGGLIIYGRSDAVLNPGGVRIGTAEIYRQVEKVDAVLESLACGQRTADDERVVLFVKLRDGLTLDESLEKAIRTQIREGASPRHVPAVLLQVADIPKTISGKIVELAVKNVIHGEPVHNLGALANPEALDYFKNRPELAS